LIELDGCCGHSVSLRNSFPIHADEFSIWEEYLPRTRYVGRASIARLTRIHRNDVEATIAVFARFHRAETASISAAAAPSYRVARHRTGVVKMTASFYAPPGRNPSL
jgi:hypothetical protein